MTPAWRRIAGTGLTALAALTLVLMIRPRPQSPYRPDNELSALSEQLGSARADAGLLKWIASLADAKELARRLPSSRPGDAAFRFEAPLSAAAAARIEQSLREELATIAPRGTAHPIVVIARVDSVALGGAYRRTVVLPDAPGQPCVVIFSVSPQNLSAPGVFATDRLLGTCGFYAVFGPAGRGMANWLRETNMELATHYQRPAALGNGIERIEVRFLSDETSRALASCAAGRAGACTKSLDRRVAWDDLWPWRRPSRDLYELAPHTVPGAVMLLPSGGSLESNWMHYGFLSDMARELGTERFSAIWRDERPLAEAYEALEGRAMDSWVTDRVTARVLPYHPGPWIDDVPLALALALMGAGAFAGIRFAKRQMS